MPEGFGTVHPAVAAKLKGYMGLAVRAGQGIFGMDACIGAIRSGKAALLLLDGGISSGSMEKYQAVMMRRPVAFAVLPEGLLFDATGKPGAAMVVRDGGFAAAMASLLTQRRETDSSSSPRGRVRQSSGIGKHCGGANVE